jgi:hypothetical protein
MPAQAGFFLAGFMAMSVTIRPMIASVSRIVLWLSGAALAVCLIVPPLAAQVPPFADPEPPARLLYVVVEDDRITASNILFSRSDEFRLSALEQIAEQREGNAVVVVATNRRLIAYSVYTAAWFTLPFKAGEVLETLEAEDFSAFAVTSRRILNFNGRIGYWSASKR